MRGQDAAGTAGEKRDAALRSVAAGCFLTALKVIVGLASGSLGILAEAAHSGLDLAAAAMTLLAVRISARPPDETHPYGHGKVENLSALFEAGLLLLTAFWVGSEAVQRLAAGHAHVDAGAWAFLVMGVSIAVDLTRSRSLRRTAMQTHSDALAADALHFRTDIWSSVAVLIGLSAVRAGTWGGWPGPWDEADAVAALAVCGVVLFAGGRMVKTTVDVLLDRAPTLEGRRMADAARGVPGVIATRAPRLRRVGDTLFADMVVQIPRTASFSRAHQITEAVESAVQTALPEAAVDLVLHMEPAASPGEGLEEVIRHLAREAGMRVHDLHLSRLEGQGIDVDLHLEVDPGLTLMRAQALAQELEAAVHREVPAVRAVHSHLEELAPAVEQRLDSTAAEPLLVERIRSLTDSVAGPGACRGVHLYRPQSPPVVSDGEHPDEPLDVTLYVRVQSQLTIPDVHRRAEEVERALRDALPQLRRVLVQVEPDS